MASAAKVTPREADSSADPRSVSRPPASVDQLTDRNIRTIVELGRAARATSSLGQRLATAVAAYCGSMTFVWIHVAWFTAWIVLNTSPWLARHPDPFPFTFLTLIVSLEAIFLSAFILISQSQENRLTEQRSQLDLQINLLTEQENTEMLKILRRVADKVGVAVDPDLDLAAFEAAIRPEKLAEQLEQATAQGDADRLSGSQPAG